MRLRVVVSVKKAAAAVTLPLIARVMWCVMWSLPSSAAAAMLVWCCRVRRDEMVVWSAGAGLFVERGTVTVVVNGELARARIWSLALNRRRGGACCRGGVDFCW